MSGRSCVVFLPDDTGKTGNPRPLMLQKIMGAPLLKWLAYALRRSDVNRFFLVCKEAFLQEAQTCFPADCQVDTARDESPEDLLHVFLSTADEAEEDLLVVTGPVIYAPSHAMLDPGREPRYANACMVGRQELMDALDTDFSFSRFLREHGDVTTDRDGFFSVASITSVAQWQPVLSRLRLYELAESGVEIWDYDNCYVEPGIEVGIGTVLLPGTILRGKTRVGYGCVIGPNTQIVDSVVGNHTTVDSSRLDRCKVASNAVVGPFANLRPGTELGPKTKAGAFTELKNAKIEAGSAVPHLSYVGDAYVGEQVNIGCGVITANYDRNRYNRTVIEKNAFIGCNSVLVAPVTVGQGAYVAAGSTITDDVPAQALGIGRSRQAVRKEWALRNKKEE